MTSKKWCITFILTFCLILFLYAGFNMLVDPFGVFNDVVFDWYSYNMTNNPRAAKIAYLEKNDNYKKYDSYIIGCSSASSFPVEDLNKFFGGSWYNMIMYGADMLDNELTCKYLIENYDAKNIIINVFASNITKYDEEEDNITRNLHYKVDGDFFAEFYSRYMFLNPMYSIAKIKAFKEDGYLTKPYDVFNIKTGAYDKKVRDIEPIGNIQEYLKNNPSFETYSYTENGESQIDNTIESIKRIKEFCDSKNVNVSFIMEPVYSKHLMGFSKEIILEFYQKLAMITDFWDFTTSSLTNEPRFFYDPLHLRNAFGTMAIAKMANTDEIYYPDDIGEYITKENVVERVNKLWNYDNKVDYIKKVPILMFHSIVDEPKNNAELSEKSFENHIKNLVDNGYTGITFDQLIDYVEKGTLLPDKPICITFDDGYLNNYERAFPILKKYNMKATIFAIGSSIGSLENYKDTKFPITPHFTYEQADIMQDSGLISIQSHTYEMHDWKPYEEGNDFVRENILKIENESEQEYLQYLANDLNIMRKEFKTKLGTDIYALAFPSGKHDTLSDVALAENGIKVTVGIEEGVNEIIKGLPQSLLSLKRINVDESVTAKALLDKINN